MIDLYVACRGVVCRATDAAGRVAKTARRAKSIGFTTQSNDRKCITSASASALLARV